MNLSEQIDAYAGGFLKGTIYGMIFNLALYGGLKLTTFILKKKDK